MASLQLGAMHYIWQSLIIEQPCTYYLSYLLIGACKLENCNRFCPSSPVDLGSASPASAGLAPSHLNRGSRDASNA